MHGRTARTLGLALLAVASTAAAETWDKSQIRKAQALHRKGVAALQKNELTEAHRHFSDAVEAVSEFPDAHLGLGHVALAQKDFEAALREYRRARDGYASLGTAMLQIQTERFAETQRTINRLRDEMNHIQSTAATSKSTESQTFRGVTAIEDQIRQLEAVQPPDASQAGSAPPEIHFHIGNALYRLERLDEAIDEWELCRAGNPGFALVHNNLAVAYFTRGRFAEAQAALAEAERLGFNPNPRFKADLADRTAPKTPS